MTHIEDQLSPFLQFCKDSPIDWYPWDFDSIEEARKVNKPIFLSIGYAVCYWCFRMEKEVFSHADVAQFFNQNFLCIKLDKDEHPHVDKLYMELSQILLQSVPGWPLNVFLTNDLTPFFSMGYVPLHSSGGEIGMDELLPYLKNLWSNSKEQLCAQGEEIVRAVERSNAINGKGGGIFEKIPFGIEAILSISDPVEGGIKSLPKFPPTASLAFLLQQSMVSEDNRLSYSVDLTLKKMMQGSVIDPICGGVFHYANSADWNIPHGEKTLYDNIFLAEMYIDGAVYFKQKAYEVVARNLCAFIVESFGDSSGGFYTQQGPKYDETNTFSYAYSTQKVEQILNTEEKEYLYTHFTFQKVDETEEEGYFVYSSKDALETVYSSPVYLKIKEKFFDLKNKDLFLDKKKICAWNADATRLFFKASLYFDDNRYREAFKNTLLFIEASFIHESTLYRRNISGETKFLAGLDDYIALVRLYIFLYEMGEGTVYLQKATHWADQVLKKFQAPDKGLYSVADEQNFLFRKCEYHDGSLPAGNGIGAQCFSKLYDLTNQEKYSKVADQIIKGGALYFESSAPFMCSFMQGAYQHVSREKKTVAIILDSKNHLKDEIQRALIKQYLPHVTCIWKEFNDQAILPIISDLNDQEPIEDQTTLYVSDNVKKSAPVYSSNEIMDIITSLSTS